MAWTERNASRLIRRSALLDRLIRRAARCVAITAPAGYGKTVLASQIAKLFPDSVVCDCAEAHDLSQFAQRVVAAIAAHHPERAEVWASEQLAAIGHSEDTQLLAVRAWSSPGAPALVTFENAEALCDVPGAGTLLRRLLDSSNRKVLICARRSVDVPLGHGLGPDDFTLIGFPDLAFTPAEVRAVAGPASEEQMDRLLALTEGWPIAVSLIARMRQAADLSLVLDEAERRPAHELHEYLLSQVLSGLTPRVMDTLIAAAVIPQPTVQEIRMAVGQHADDDLSELITNLPVTITGLGVHVHPVLACMLREQYPERARAALRDAASTFEQAGVRARAAELYLSLGDSRAAANALQDVGAYLISTPTLAESIVLASLDEQTLIAFPRLWCAAIVHRGYAMPPDEWLRTALAIWRELDPGENPVVRASVAGSVVNAYVNPGHIAEARTFLDSFANGLAPDDLHGHGTVALFGAAIDSYLGKAGCIERSTQFLTPFFAASPVTHAIYLYEIIAPFQRLQGRRDLERETLDRSVQLGIGSDMPIYTLMLVEATFAAWFAGENEASAEYLAQLEARVTPAVSRGMRFFIACAHGRGLTEPFGYEKAKTRVEGLLMASSLATSPADAVTLVRRAVETADQSSRPFYRIVARVALAGLLVDESAAALDEAERLARSIDPPALAEALAKRRGGEKGTMLDAFAERFVRFVQDDAVQLRILDGTLRVHGQHVHVSDREFAMLAALAREPRWYTGAELAADMFWDVDAEGGQNRVYVYLHRLRKRFGATCVVETSRTGYRLHPDVDVDVWKWSRLLNCVSVKRWASLHPAERQQLVHLAKEPPNERRARPLPEALEQSLQALRRRTRAAVAAALLEEGNAADALTIAEFMIREEPESESGHEIAIRSHLRQGDRTAALARWDAYRAIVVSDLQAEPGDELRRLIG